MHYGSVSEFRMQTRVSALRRGLARFLFIVAAGGLIAVQAMSQSAELRAAAEALQRQDYVRARVECERAVRADPLSAPGWKMLGMAFAAENRLEDAYTPFSRACELNAGEAGACYYLGRTAFYLSRLSEAESAFRRSMQRPDDRPRALLGLAAVLETRGKTQEAERAFSQAIELGAEGAQRDFGLFLYRTGRHVEAVKALEAAGAADDLVRIRRELAATPSSTARGERPGSIPIHAITFDVTALPMISRNGASGEKHLPETMMGGIAVLDFDNDGYQDIYVSSGARMPALIKADSGDWNRLFRNRGDGTFEDVTQQAGVAGKGYAMGVAAGDFDSDGWVDLFVAGLHGNFLYRNLGDGRFADVTARAGVGGDGKWSIGGAWLDYDRDGRLDLFVVRYVEWDPDKELSCGDREPGGRTYCHPSHYEPLHNLLYRNEGDGRFRDVSKESGIAAHLGKGMGLAIGDYDGDGGLDIFVANDTLPNFLFHNEAGRFMEVATESGVALPSDGRPVSSMGASFGDFDNDGKDDLIVSALSNETFPLFRNLGKGQFQDISTPSRIASQMLPYSGWGIAFVDLDNDGRLDIFSANGHVMDNAERSSSRTSRQPMSVLRNQGNGTFHLELLRGDAFHRGAAVADFDRDGRMDLVVTRLNEAPLVLRNTTEADGHWLTVRLEGNPPGARVRCTTKSGARWGSLNPSNGYASSSESAIHFGLGMDLSVEELKITWPDGCVQTMANIPADRDVLVKRNCGQ